MYTKFMIAMYRYRLAVAQGEDKALALVHAIESVAESESEYITIYNIAKEVA